MTRRATRGLAVLIAILTSSLITQARIPIQKVDEPPPIELTAQEDVNAARDLQDTLSALSEKVTACVKAGKPPESCRCGYPHELNRLGSGYDLLIKDHPDWKDRTLSFRYNGKDGKSVSGLLALRTLRRQRETLTCKVTPI